jgi:hypothetical protein
MTHDTLLIVIGIPITASPSCVWVGCKSGMPTYPNLFWDSGRRDLSNMAGKNGRSEA